ncbi:MAG TPA: PKD domain-containing protein, partial [Saprospiraceae bacterium]|nr:PKD domain-containing protein [Saprospiraceae bacterium]
MKKLLSFLLIASSFTLANRLSAECHAAFTWEQITNTLSIHFFSQSTSDHDITSYSWNFGDGHEGDGQNPTHTYAEAGTYHVCLIIHDNAGCVSDVCHDVVVAPLSNSCEAAFTFELGADNNHLVHFHDASTSNHDIVSWLWHFGDGESSDQQNPTHIYTNPGTYQVCLIITDNTGCVSDVCHNVVIPEPDNCEASFTAEPTNDPLTWDFFDSSTSDHQIIHWHWTFGDDHNSDAQDPTHTYAEGGTYNVCLSIVSETGCEDQFCMTIQVQGSGSGCHASFTAEPGDNPLIWHFNSTSTSDHDIVTYAWTFGDGGTSDNHAPTHTYDHGGTYTVCLTITDGSGCSDTFCMEITVVEPGNGCHASFTAEPGDNPLIWHFNSTSTSDHDIIHYMWTFGDGGVSDNHAPTHTYDHGGTYTVCLTITDGSGCSDTVCMDITVVEPADECHAAFTANAGDNPLVWHFHDQSTSTHDIVSWEWHFGDGGTSTLQNPEHVY